jgi:GTP-binding protein EngB required for normal cell division
MVEIEQDLKDEAFFNKIVHSKIPVLLLLNKIDNSNQEQLEKQVAFGQRKCLMQRYILYPPCRTLMFRSFSKDNFALTRITLSKRSING